MIMRPHLLSATLVVAALLSAACSSAPAVSRADDRTQQDARLTRAVLAEASSAATAYGREHLGHFLDLDPTRLEKQGLEVPDTISLKVRSSHRSYCITTINEALPSIHPWAVATVSSRASGPSPADRCERR